MPVLLPDALRLRIQHRLLWPRWCLYLDLHASPGLFFWCANAWRPHRPFLPAAVQTPGRCPVSRARRWKHKDTPACGAALSSPEGTPQPARPAPGIRPGPRPQNSPSLGEPAFHASFSANVSLPPGISSQTPSYASRWVGGEGAGPADPGQELTSRSGTWEETTLPLQEYEGTSCQGKPANHFPFLAQPQPLPRARSHFPPRAPACAFPLGAGPSLGWSSLRDSPLPGRTVLPAGQP